MHPLGSFGLLLMLIVARLTASASDRPLTTAERARGWLARRAIDGIATLGWMVDHLAPGPKGAATRQGISAEVSHTAPSC
jgi:hypothetical protein